MTELLRRVDAVKAGWLMPSYSGECECLVLLIASSGHAEAVLADVHRFPDSSPALGEWSAPTVRVEGLFVEALLAGVARSCPDCGVDVGMRHGVGCDVERCIACGGQRLLCACDAHSPEDSAWSGEWPGLAECRARGWYARRAAVGWEPCGAEDEGAREDLNRLEFFRQEGHDGLYGNR